ncbi:AraC family transcriptional regulator [Pacificispira sp.]|uniref:AraC family transcriptional regulator n=1 Tax=Pacificispira sp. TaxID=2888761 RepID=UPI003BAB6715
MVRNDPLSDVLDALRLTGGMYFTADLRGDFAIVIPEDGDTIRIHGGLDGDCMVTVPGLPPIGLAAGDWVLIPHGATQTLFRDNSRPAVPLNEALSAGTLTPDGRFQYGETGACTTLLCGFCRFRAGFNHPVLSQLPKVVVLRAAEIRNDPPLTALLGILAAEHDGGQPGGTAILTRSMEMLLLYALRRLTGKEMSATPGFLTVLADRRLRRSVEAIHNRPEARWTLSDLAREAGMSRTAFAEAFAARAGMAPAAYLRLWRMIRARDLLRHTDLDVSEIAARCGYESVPSFSIRFKKETGLGPGAFRRLDAS